MTTISAPPGRDPPAANAAPRIRFLYIVLRVTLLASFNLAVTMLLAGAFFYDQVNRPNEEALWIARAYFDAHPGNIRNKTILTIVDFSQPSFAKRMHILNLQSGEIHSYLVAHGSAMKGGHLFIPAVSNAPESHSSSAGFMLTAEEYTGIYGRSLRLDGLEARISNVRSRGIVIHGASWFSYRFMGYYLRAGLVPRIGESSGCLAVPTGDINDIIDRLGNGALIYVHVDKHDSL